MKVDSVAGEIHWEELLGKISAKGFIPLEAGYFQDHFPRFPVLPGVLALEILKRIAEDFLIRKIGNPDSRWCLTQLSGVRFSAYLRPGDEWEAQLECVSQEKERVRWKGSLSSRGRTAAQVQFVLEDKENGRSYGR